MVTIVMKNARVALALSWFWLGLSGSLFAEETKQAAIDFNHDVRPILANNCYKCHGPDEAERKGGSDGLRLDTRAGALLDQGGYAAIVPGKPDESELVRRITSQDDGERMPPAGSARQLTAEEIRILAQWVAEGANYATHWSYVVPQRPELPNVQHRAWPKNELDYFILARLEREGLSPAPEADRYALIRRLSLDLTGLPPTLDEVERFVNDPAPDAYEQLVHRLLEKDAYGEHWARMWLDLARYADSAGYADDPPRTIWAYRDYVIRALNANRRFNEFTIEQLAGDLLPQPTEEQLIATAFHRNTVTNNEGGTNDEEFRNVAVVDRVNTTMAVWMGTTIACAQCHNHKYDPITQEEFFRLFAIFNNSQDADRRDESPLIDLYSTQQLQQKREWEQEVAELESVLRTSTPQLAAAQKQWEQTLDSPLPWEVLVPDSLASQSGATFAVQDDQSVLATKAGKTDVYSLEFPYSLPQITAVKLETGSGHGGGNFVVSRLPTAVIPPDGQRLKGQYLRIEIPGNDKILSLAEVQILQGGTNIAPQGEATQSSTDFGGPAELAIDGNTDGNYNDAKSTTHTRQSNDPWWQLDLKSRQAVDRVVIWNRTDNNLHTRLKDFRIRLLDENLDVVWEAIESQAPNPSLDKAVGGARSLSWGAALADYAQESFDASSVVGNQDTDARGWAVGGQTTQPHELVLLASAATEAGPGSRLTLAIEQLSKHEFHTLGRFRVSATADPRAAQLVQTPPSVLAAIRTPQAQRTDEQQQEVTLYYLQQVAPGLKPQRERLAVVKKHLAELKPYTTVPVMRELAESDRRTTKLQHRGNFLDEGAEVSAGVPAVFHPLPTPRTDRLALAQWLVDPQNPLTARVIVNRYWESIFGVGIVRTSEEFGTQGELPSHPELLDWLATEFQRDWDMKRLLRLLVTSASYRQSSRVTPELLDRDPENRLLARGPRFRMSAEMIRDQALYVSGLLSEKIYGPPVRPPQPKMGINAAFGSGIDWQTSEGEDKFRRGLYTTWRRSNPYPSMATFDAPNREVCTLHRVRTNTPLQALVTLNDPVFIEAAQGLARRIAAHEGPADDKMTFAFRVCLARPPSDTERRRLLALQQHARQRYAEQPEQATKMATDPLGPAPQGADVAELAAWTVISNVLLNLDEMLMNR
jgi:mono/diheme cytochrome c family protein